MWSWLHALRQRVWLGGRSASGQSARAFKYFVYISQTKVEMLHAQLSTPRAKGITGEVKLSLGVFSAGVKGEASAEETNGIRMTTAVADYLVKHEDVGTIERPGKYIAGVLPLKHGLLWDYHSDIVFWGGVFQRKKFGLIGSKFSMIGEPERAESVHVLEYYSMRFLNRAIDDDSQIEDVDGYPVPEAIKQGLAAIKGPPTQFEFLAKVMHRQKSAILATPIYVAAVD